MKITKKDIDYIVQVIVKGYQPEKIYLFGSFNSDNVTQDSDIDLLIIKQTQEKFYRRPLQVHTLFKPYKYNLDIHIYTPTEFNTSKDIINTIANNVINHGRLVYEC